MFNKTRKILIVCALALPLSCSVKEEPTQKPQPIVEAGLPEGVWSAKNRHFLVFPSKHSLSVNEREKVSYRVVEANLAPLRESVAVKVSYWMPSMPTMKITPAQIVRTSSGVFEVTYDISMEGSWEITIGFYDGDSLLDTITVPFEVEPVP